jgi:hypothetical protein
MIDLTIFKSYYNKAIDAVLSSTGLTIPCKLIFESTKPQQCPNCIYDTMSQKSANIYKSGGPIVFVNGQTCPYCLGNGITANYTNEQEVYFAVLTNAKDFIGGTLNQPDISAQTICSIDYIDKIRKCSKIIFNTDIPNLSNNIFIRANEPQPVGLGDNRYIFTNWTRS